VAQVSLRSPQFADRVRGQRRYRRVAPAGARRAGVRVQRPRVRQRFPRCQRFPTPQMPTRDMGGNRLQL